MEPTEKLAPTAGLALLLGYNLLGLFVRRPLEERARSAKAAAAEANANANAKQQAKNEEEDVDAK